MSIMLRPYVTAGVALVGVGLIAAAPVGPTAAGLRQRAVQLTSNDTYIVDSPNHLVGLIVGGSGIPIPQLEGTYVQDANDLYIQRILPGADSEGVFTPEGASPIFSGIQSLPIGTSLVQDQYMMNTYVTQNVDAGNTVAVYGESQSAMASSQLMTELQQEGVPADAVKFVLVGNVDNPDGGWGARFDTTLPAFTTTFDVSTPADTPYETSIYIQEYDGFSDFPKYPLNILSDLNAILGLEFVHPTYRALTPEELDKAAVLPTLDYHGDTTYYIIPMSDSPHEFIPLVEPLAGIPLIGKPLADLLSPILQQIVNLGYDNPDNNGWDVGQANVPTGFGVFPSFDQVLTALKNLGPAATQGMHAFDDDLSHPSSLLAGLSSGADPSDPSGSPEPGDFLGNVTSALTSIGSLGLPAWQSLLTLGLTVPSNALHIVLENLSDPLNGVGVAAGASVAASLVVGGIDAFVAIDTLNGVLGDFGLPGLSL